MAELKKILWQGTEHWDKLLYERAAISGKLVLSDFTKNYIKSFKEKQARKINNCKKYLFFILITTANSL